MNLFCQTIPLKINTSAPSIVPCTAPLGHRHCSQSLADALIFLGKIHCLSPQGNNQSILSLALTHQMSSITAETKRTQADVVDLEMIGKVLLATTMIRAAEDDGCAAFAYFPKPFRPPFVVSSVTLILDNRCVIIAALSFFPGVPRRAPRHRNPPSRMPRLI